MGLHGLCVAATVVLTYSCFMMVTVGANEYRVKNITDCFEAKNITDYFDKITANFSVNVTFCNDTDQSKEGEISVTIWLMNTTSMGDLEEIENFTCNIDYPKTTTKKPEPTTTEYPQTATEETVTVTKPITTEYPHTATEETVTVTKPVTTGQQGSGAVDRTENKHKDRKIGITTEEEKVVVRYTNKGRFGEKGKPAFRSNFTNTLVSEVILRNLEGNVTARMVVVGMKKDNIDTGFIAAAPSTPLDDGAQIQILASVFGDEFIGISVYDNETSDKLAVEEVDFTFDVTSPTSKRRFREKILGAGDSNQVARQIVLSIKPGCSFYNGTKDNWETTGCQVEKWEKDKSVECKCTHTTVFAVMMSAEVVTVPQGVKIASYVTEVASILFLLITLVFLVKVRNRVRGDRVKVQICLTFSLFWLHTLSVLHDAALQNNTVCELWTVLTHYFFLCSAMWMLMEGITLLFKTLDGVMRILSGQNSRKFAIFRYVVSFGIPAVIVVVSAAVGFASEGVDYMPIDDSYVEPETYGKYKHCWVGSDMLLGTVIIPVSVLLLCCLLIAARMFYVVYRMSVESENFKPTDQRRNTTGGEMEDLIHIKAALKATLVLLPVLGIPWFLGFFTGIQNGGARVTFMYVNAIINGLQGVMLFFVYCVLGKEVRKAIVNRCVRKKHTLPSLFEFSSDKRRMTTDHSSYSTTVAHATLSTNMAEQSSQGDQKSNNSFDGENQ